MTPTLASSATPEHEAAPGRVPEGSRFRLVVGQSAATSTFALRAGRVLIGSGFGAPRAARVVFAAARANVISTAASAAAPGSADALRRARVHTL